MLKYRPEIDGLRTVAVLPVILFHLGYLQLSGGFYGVDVFFVISGYLITSILIEKITTHQFSMLEFWIRRVKRLLPTLLMVILAVLLIAPFAIFKPNVIDVANDTIPAIFSFSNFHALSNFGDYWGARAENSFFLHTWSLSVEEQFYLLYPFFLFVIYKYRKTFLWPIVILTAISFFLFCVFLVTDKDYAFYFLPNRIWELSIGSIASILMRDSSIRGIKNYSIYSLIGLCLIIASYFLSFEVNGGIGLMALLPVLGTFMLILFCNEHDLIGKILASKPLVFIGKISYSLYLWHWPIIVLFKTQSYYLSGYNIHVINLFIVLITFVLSLLSYAFIENKTRNSQHALKLVLVLIVVNISICLFYQSQFFNKTYAAKYNKIGYYLKYYDISPRPMNISGNLLDDFVWQEREAKYTNAFKEEGIIKRIDKKDPELILLGDSHGVMWAKLIDEICDKEKISRTFYTSNASNPFIDMKDMNHQKGNDYFTDEERNAYAKKLIENIKQWKPKVVVIACRWDAVAPIQTDYFLELLDLLSKMSVKVIVLNQPPVLAMVGDNNARQYLTYLGVEPKPGYNYVKVSNSNFFIKRNNFISELPNKFENIILYDVNSTMTNNGLSVLSKGNNLFYFDDDHLSYQGTKFHESQLEAIIAKALK